MKIITKEILYRGGMARFSIPVHWIEEYRPDGSATFFEDVPGSGTLRLNMLEFPSGADSSTSPYEDYENFRGDLFLSTEQERFTERDVDYILLNWSIGYQMDGNGFRIACFHHTVESELFRSAQTQKELEIIKSIVWNVEFGRQPGEV